MPQNAQNPASSENSSEQRGQILIGHSGVSARTSSSNWNRAAEKSEQAKAPERNFENGDDKKNAREHVAKAGAEAMQMPIDELEPNRAREKCAERERHQRRQWIE